MPDGMNHQTQQEAAQRTAAHDKPIQSDPLGNLLVSAIAAPFVGAAEVVALHASPGVVALGHVAGEVIIAGGELVHHVLHDGHDAHSTGQTHDVTGGAALNPAQDGANVTHADHGDAADHQEANACYNPAQDGANVTHTDHGDAADHQEANACYNPAQDGANVTHADHASAPDQGHNTGVADHSQMADSHH